jgi:response regulator RpfG family c-di-GMP phosphodiesterase
MDIDRFIHTEKDMIIQNLISVWIDLLEARNLESKEHSERVSHFAARFARKLGLNAEDQKKVFFGAQLHDIGKLGVQDSILLKKDRLTKDEFSTVKQYPLFAQRMLEDSPYLAAFSAIPVSNHERWDGQGYPFGKKEEEIPFDARLYAIVDAWDALTNDRPFRQAIGKDKALEIIKESRGSQFDPDLVDSFIEMIQEKDVSANGNTIILIVDDEPYLRLALHDLFTREGFDCRSASGSKEALGMLESMTPALIVSDIMMPSMNGFDFKRALPAISPELADIPFIFLSAKTTQKDKLEGYDLKIDDYITKPFEPSELLAKVKAILRRSEVIKRQEEQLYTRQINNLTRVINQNTTHELKSPLGIIIGNLEVVMRKFNEVNDPVIGSCLVDAKTSALRLQNVIDQLLYLYKSDNQIVSDEVVKIDLERDVHATIAEAVKFWSSKNLSIHLDINDKLNFSAPISGFLYTLSQLVDNACKFARQDGKVQVSLSQVGDSIELSVENDGTKIPPILREKVFDRFFQVSSGDARDAGGLGLGLSIAKNFADSCGGKIEAIESKLGNCIRLQIPSGLHPIAQETVDVAMIGN